MRTRRQARCVVAALTLAAWCSSAQAWTGQVSWPTFYRAGPGRNYTVLDEFGRGKMIDVLSCQNGWCQVRNEDSIGYTEQKWILKADQMPEKPTMPGPEGCVESRVTGSGYHGGLDYRFCPQSTPGKVSSGQPAPGSAEPAQNQDAPN